MFTRHLKGDIERAKENYANITQYHAQFTETIDSVLNHFIPSMITELKAYTDRELTTKVEDKMMKSLRLDLDKYLHIPANDQEMAQLELWYRHFQIGWDQSNPCKLPEHYSYAIYLPTGVIPENVIMAKISKELQTKLVSLSDELWRLEYGIHLLTPVMDDTNNTGVWVQQSVRYWIAIVEANVDLFLSSIGQNYFTSRISYLREIFYYRQSVDIRLDFLRWERDYFRFIRDMARDLSMTLLIIHHSIMLHIDLIKNPRVDHSANYAAKIINWYHFAHAIMH